VPHERFVRPPPPHSLARKSDQHRSALQRRADGAQLPSVRLSCEHASRSLIRTITAAAAPLTSGPGADVALAARHGESQTQLAATIWRPAMAQAPLKRPKPTAGPFAVAAGNCLRAGRARVPALHCWSARRAVVVYRPARREPAGARKRALAAGRAASLTARATASPPRSQVALETTAVGSRYSRAAESPMGS